MSDLTIITNNVPRDIIEGWELTSSEREDFDYLDWNAIDGGLDSASFVRYKGQLYDLGDFEAATLFPGWNGYVSDTFFSGILVRWVNTEQVVMGRFFS